jgi:uncharacterized protein (DUF433 family)
MARRRETAAAPRSVRFRPWVKEQVERIARRNRRGFSEVAQDLIEEALRMRLCPGVYFADEPAGRDAKVAGTALGVWEVIRDYRAEGRDLKRLRRSLPQINHAHIQAALRYYAAWPEEIDEIIADNADATPATR